MPEAKQDARTEAPPAVEPSGADKGMETSVADVMNAFKDVQELKWTNIQEESKGGEGVLDVLARFNIPDSELSKVFEKLIVESAEKMGFWRPTTDTDKKLIKSCVDKLKKRFAKYKKLHEEEEEKRKRRGSLESLKSNRYASEGTPEDARAATLVSSGDHDARAVTVASTVTSVMERRHSKERAGTVASAFRASSKERAGTMTSAARAGTVAESRVGTASDLRAGTNSTERAGTRADTRAGTTSTGRVGTNMTGMTTDSAYLMKGASLFHSKSNLAELGDSQVVKEKSLNSINNQHSYRHALLVSNSAVTKLRQYEVILFIVNLIGMLLYALYPFFGGKTPGIYKAVGVWILIAKGSAFGTVFWTAMLFFTMSRNLVTWFCRFSCVRKSQILMQFINCFKEIHLFSTTQICLWAAVHTIAHHVGTFPAIGSHTAEELNAVLNCAKDDDFLETRFWTYVDFLQFPACPLPEDHETSYFDGVLSTPGITGYLLIVIFLAIGWNSRQSARKKNFRLFFALHHVLMPSWVLLLLFHGVNDWVGLGYPVTILFAGLPMISYAYARFRRWYLTCTDVQVAKAVKSLTGKLLHLELQLPPQYRECVVGQYAFINIPDLAKYEWHPFTICNQRKIEDGKQIVAFCIMMPPNGNWTKSLKELFKAKDESGECLQRPRVHMDGPFYAPAVSMPDRSIIVGVGSGVGTTPFLSFLGGIAENMGGNHKHAHIFWTSNYASDFLLFSDILSQVDMLTAKQICQTNFHLHATPAFGPWRKGGPSYGQGALFNLAARDVWKEWETRFKKRGGSDGDDEMAKLPTFCQYPENFKEQKKGDVAATLKEEEDESEKAKVGAESAEDDEDDGFAVVEKAVYGVISKSVLKSDKPRPLALAVGMPNFEYELLAIGNDQEEEDVFVYFCGNPRTQDALQLACVHCNETRAMQGKKQRYYFYFERFG